MALGLTPGAGWPLGPRCGRKITRSYHEPERAPERGAHSKQTVKNDDQVRFRTILARKLVNGKLSASILP